MADERSELRGIVWTEVFPFLRLFTTFKQAIHIYRLLLALVCVLGCYFGGRILDRVWLAAGGGVPVEEGGRRTEIDAYATQTSGEFESWKQQAERARQRLEATVIARLSDETTQAEAEEQLATRPASRLLQTGRHEKDVDELRGFIDERLAAALAAIDENDALSADQKEERQETLKRSADVVRLGLAGCDIESFNAVGGLSRSLTTFLDTGEPIPPDEGRRLSATLAAQIALNALEESAPRGPFITLLSYEMRCFAGAVRGACTFRWGIAGGVSDPQPSLLGSIASAGSGISWLVTQRPCYAVFYGVLHFVIFALFGGAICRHAAIQITRDESIGLGEALRFAREKYAGLLLAPVVPLGIFLLAAVVMWIGGLVGAIPVVGELLAGLLYGLALLGGFALAMILIATLLGLHLMWPTIAVEGSDAFDAVTHALGYVGQRAWHTGFYTLMLLLYGGVSFVMVRLIGTLMLKLTHVATGAGMSLFGAVSSAQTSTIAKLDAMWQMPAWGELSLLPTTGATPFWGTFGNAPLRGSEWLAMIFLACWVFLVVGLVGAFVVSFFFCGSTQMYLLLRRNVDAVDYDEIFYEEPEEEFPPVEEPAATATEPEEPGPPEPPAEPPEPPAEPPADSPPGASPDQP